MSGTTLKELAEYTGLSIRTVNRALKGDSSVVPEKRTLILEAAAKLHYVPNMAARNLRLKRSSFVGIIGAEIHQEVNIKRLFCLENTLKNHGYYPLLGSLGSSEESVIRLLNDWSGIISHVVMMCGGEMLDRPALAEFVRSRPLRFLLLDQPEGRYGARFSIDRSPGVFEAISYLISAGHRTILRCGDIVSREVGFRGALASFPEDRRPRCLHLSCRPEFEDGYALGEQICASGADAVFCDTDRLAFGFMHYAAEHRIRIPEDIAVIGFDDEPADQYVYPALSTVAHPLQELSEAITDFIMNSPEDWSGYSQVFQTRFIRRKSA